jgi:hypothetical protein
MFPFKIVAWAGLAEKQGFLEPVAGRRRRRR